MEPQLQHQQATICDYVTQNQRGSPPTAARLQEFGPTVAPVGPYSPQVLFYPPPPEAIYGLPPQHQHRQQAEPYFYYYPTGHASRQSPDALSAKMSPPPVGLPMPLLPPPPPPPPMCYGPYSPPCCCCAQLHYQHLQPRCSPDHLMFPQQRQLPTVALQEFVPAPVQQSPSLPPPLQSRMKKVTAKTAAAAEPMPQHPQARGADAAFRRRPTGETELQASGSWVMHDLQLQQRRRNGYMQNILYKTELCRDMHDRGACPRGRACQFAHSPTELHDPRRHPLYKTAFCYDFKNKGHCPRGERCFHVHEIKELAELAAPLPQLPLQDSNISGVRRGGASGRRRRSPAAPAEAALGSKPAPDATGPWPSTASNGGNDGNGGGGNGVQRGGRTGKSATSETSRFLMKKLSSKPSPSSTGRRPSAGCASTAPVEAGLGSLKGKARRLRLGASDGVAQDSVPRSAQ